MIKVVFTGGPYSGKTQISKIVFKELTPFFKIEIIPETVRILAPYYKREKVKERLIYEKAIFTLQKLLEDNRAYQNPHLMICDRGSLDVMPYTLLSGLLLKEDDFWKFFNTSLKSELKRYQAIIYLQTAAFLGQFQKDEVRTSNIAWAKRVDQFLLKIYQHHPLFFYVPAYPNFLDKIQHILNIFERKILPLLLKK